MTLKEISKQLEELDKQLPELIKKTEDLEYVYEKRYFDLMLHSGFGNQTAREAEAKTTCDVEGLLMPYLEAKLQLRIALNHKEFLIELSRNARVLERGGEL